MSDSGELIPVTHNLSDAVEEKVRAAVEEIEKRYGLSIGSEGRPSVEVLKRKTQLQLILNEATEIAKLRARDEPIIRVWEVWIEGRQITKKKLAKNFARDRTAIGRWIKNGHLPDEELYKKAKKHIEDETNLSIKPASPAKELYHVIIEATHQIRMRFLNDEDYVEEERLTLEELTILSEIRKKWSGVVEVPSGGNSNACLTEILKDVHDRHYLRPSDGRWRIRNPHRARSLWSEWRDAYLLVLQQVGRMILSKHE